LGVVGCLEGLVGRYGASGDNEYKTKGFKYANTGLSTDYEYDANGNLKKDRNKGIENIVYNYLNLPQTITFTGGRSIEFVYDATGMKLRKTVKAPNVADVVTDYMDGFEYKDGTLEKIYHTEGYVERKVDGTFQYNYTLKDHLGNTRVTFADLNNSGTIDPNTEINQINHYAPFGLNLEGNWNGASAEAKNKYQYNDKELNTEFGLNLNDYGARFYDATIGQFTTQDRFAEKYINLSPYHYGKNNPIKYIDINGDSSIVGIYANYAKGAMEQRAALLYDGAQDGNMYVLVLGDENQQIPKSVKSFSEIVAWAKAQGGKVVQASSSPSASIYDGSGQNKWMLNKEQTEFLLVAMMNTAGMDASYYGLNPTKSDKIFSMSAALDKEGNVDQFGLTKFNYSTIQMN
jgi:RHS repeat-associated protein